MIRNLKALGLALVAVFAMSAMVASGASAEGTHVTPGVFTSDGPVHVNGEQVEEENNYLSALGIKVECNTVEFTNTDPKTEVENYFQPEESSEITISPNYEGCHAGARPATVFMNGCDYDFTVDHVETTEPAQTSWELSAGVTCPEGKDITVVIYNDAEHTEEWCNAHIGEAGNTKIPGLTAIDEGETLGVEGVAEPVKATFTARPCTFGLELTLNTKLATEVLLEGENTEGEETPIDVHL